MVKDDYADWHKFVFGVTCYARWRKERQQWGYDWRVWRSETDLIEYIDGLVKGKYCLYIIASNPTFDLWVLDAFRTLYNLGWKLAFFYDKGLTFILKCTQGKRSIAVLAIQNFYMQGVKALGEMVGLPKLAIDYNADYGDDVVEYCRRDVEILVRAFESWLRFITDSDLGGFALTRSSQAMRAFRHRFLRYPVLIHGDATLAEWERNAYYGGRTECFAIGEFTDGPFIALDVNGMYAYQMLTMQLPNKPVNSARSVSMDYVEHTIGQYAYVAHVWLETKEPVFAVRQGNKVVFPVGKFDTWVCTPALQYAFAIGAVKRIGEFIQYEQAPLFKPFVEFFHGQRQRFKAEGNKPFEQACKYTLNGFYGKWGSRYPQVIESHSVDSGQLRRERCISYETGETGIFTVLMGKAWTEMGKVEANNNAIAISAHVTEGARMHLWGLIRRLPRGRVLYCDTDSLMIRKADAAVYADVTDEKELGKLWAEKEAERLVIHALKDYEWGSKVVIKGIRADAERVRPGVFRQHSFPGLYTLLRKAEPGLFPIVNVQKTLKRVYDKGTLDTSTGIVMPFLF